MEKSKKLLFFLLTYIYFNDKLLDDKDDVEKIKKEIEKVELEIKKLEDYKKELLGKLEK